MKLISKLSGYIYNKKILPFPQIAEVYGAYSNNNLMFHKVHRIKSYCYLKRLHKAYNKGENLWNVALPKGAKRFDPIKNGSKNATGTYAKPLTGEKKAAVKPVRKFPYLDGAESESEHRVPPLQLAQALMDYDIISFDVFDTLLLRPFDQPTTLFLLLAYKHGILDFCNIRIEAEREARKRSLALNKNSEINIYDIYEIVHEKTGLDIETGVRVEIETEKEMCLANPYMMRVFKALKERNKRIIAVSDMYLPGKQIQMLLENCGYSGIEKVYVSCDYYANKRETLLFAQVKNDFGKQLKYAHVGDNKVSDFSSAKISGFDAFLYKNVNEAGNVYRAEGMTRLTGSIYSGLINSELHNGTNHFTPHYEYGFIYGGLYVLGYCNWIHNYCLKNGIQKVLFLSRDGAIYQKVFRKLFNDIEDEYVHWSRIANTKCIVSFDKFDFLTRMVHHKAIAPDKITLHSLLRSISLLELESGLKEFKLASDMLLTPANEEMVVRFFNKNWQKVIDIYNETENELRDGIEKAIKGFDRVAIVDVGWIGSGPYGLKRLIENKWSLPCKVDCLIAACKFYHPEATTVLLQNDELHAYMFSVMENRINYDRHAGTNKGLNNIFFELFTQDTTPSFAGIENGEYLFDYPEVENYHIIGEIQKGIFDFCCKFDSIFKNYRFVYNISGYDAYLPFRMIIKDLKFIKKYFGDFSYARGVASDIDNQKIDTIKSLIEGNIK